MLSSISNIQESTPIGSSHEAVLFSHSSIPGGGHPSTGFQGQFIAAMGGGGQESSFLQTEVLVPVEM